MTMNNQPEQVENIQQFTAILQVRQYDCISSKNGMVL